tara:strand:- start:235 stop:441 length:207 start_codon:yes stop_codon:yes gene_type:complete
MVDSFDAYLKRDMELDGPYVRSTDAVILGQLNPRLPLLTVKVAPINDDSISIILQVPGRPRVASFPRT